MAFRRSRLTVTAIIQTLNHWAKRMDEEENVDGINSDFSKAFYRVSHRLLLFKMSVVGIHPRIVSWVRSFPSDRKYVVRVNASFSSPRSLHSGVTQGWVVLPVLFNSYTHDLLRVLSLALILCFCRLLKS